MDYSLHIYTICMEKSILYFKGLPARHSIKFLSLKIVFILENSAGPYEMPPSAVFHLGLHCLLKYLFIGIQDENG